MSDTGSVTQWISMLKGGHRDAIEPLWRRYVERLIRLARSKLAESSRKVADEEDVVVNAFDAFVTGVELGRFERLQDRDDLWQILVMITERKAIDLIRWTNAERRGGGWVNEASVDGGDRPPGERGVNRIVGHEPTAEFAMQAAEQFGRLMEQLDDHRLRDVARLRLEGLMNHEIAERLEISVRSVERKVGLIRRIWEREL